jgi:hypothetical protein
MSSIGNPGSLEAWKPQGLTDERGHPLPILAFPQWLRTSDCQRSTFLSTLRTGPPRTGRAQRKAAALGVGWQPSPDVSAPSREGSPHGSGSPGILPGGRTQARRWPPDPWRQPPDVSTHTGRLPPFGGDWGAYEWSGSKQIRLSPRLAEDPRVSTPSQELSAKPERGRPSLFLDLIWLVLVFHWGLGLPAGEDG